MMSQIQEKKKEIKEENISKVLKKLDELTKLFDLRTRHANNLGAYKTIQGQSQYLYYIKKESNYTKALHLITEILDLIRDEPLMLEVYKIQRDSKGRVIQMQTFKGKEADVNLSLRNKQSEQKKEIHYLTGKLQREVITDKQFLQHYENFEKIANKHFSERHFNEGHLIEAYQRHLFYVQHLNNNYLEEIPVPHVAIMLYYSMNSTGQWKGGDILYSQIKGNNTQLATQMSIIAVSSKLIELYRNPEFFNLEDFNKLFKVDIQDEMADYEKLKNLGIEELKEEIGQSDININLTM